MSDFRSKAREVYEQGVEERGNFTPTGTPLKIYQWWAKRSPNAPERENFCHFWRVVAIWAPLMWVLDKVADLAGRKSVQIYSALVAAVVIGWMVFTIHSVGVIAISLLVVLWTAIGIGVGIYLALPQEAINEDLRFNRPLLWPVFVLTLPISLIAFGFTKLGRAWKESWTDVFFYIAFGIGALIILGILVSVIIENGWLGVFIILGVLGGVAMFFVGMHFLITYFEGRRAARRKAEAERRDAFIRGEITLEEFTGKTEPREPGVIAKFFSGVLDFLILVGQVIRVKKWKICPTVEVPRTNA